MSFWWRPANPASRDQLVPGADVVVHYVLPRHHVIHAKVVRRPNRFGWVEVEQDYGGTPIRFGALEGMIVCHGTGKLPDGGSG